MILLLAALLVLSLAAAAPPNRARRRRGTCGCPASTATTRSCRARFSPDGRRIAVMVGARDGWRVALVDARTGTYVAG
jgi:hypothetical protein